MSEEQKTTEPETVGGLISSFWKAYRTKAPEQDNADWLDGQFATYPECWQSEAERRQQAVAVAEGVANFQTSQADLEAASRAGKSTAKYLDEAISSGCAMGGTQATARYLGSIDRAIAEANETMAKAVFVRNPDGTLDYTHVNQCPHLNGNIAEAHHVGTYNIDAATKESANHAEMLASHGKNSVDLVIKDGSGHVIRRYQSKYGKDAETTEAMFGTRYRGQRKLVPEGQTEGVPGSTDHLEADGVKSQPLSKEAAVEEQKEVQTSGKTKEFDYNSANTGTIVKAIGQKAMISGALAVGFQAARIVGRRLWNKVTGKANQSVEADVKEFAESAAKSGAGAAGMVAVAGGLTVAARKGLLGAVMKSAKSNVIAAAACAAVENVKILAKVGRGEVTGVEALDLAGRANASLVGSLALGAKGAAVGASIGSALGPVGTAVGGVIGGVVGGIAGSTVGEAVYQGAKTVCKAVCKAGAALVRGVGNCVRSIGRALNPFNWFC